MSRIIVLDSSAYLAFANKETGYKLVERLLTEQEVWMSAVNVAEVLSKHADIGIQSDEALSLIRLLGIRINPFDIDDAIGSGHLRLSTHSAGLSLGDRACLALAIRIQCPVYTADRAWDELVIGCEIVQIR